MKTDRPVNFNILSWFPLTAIVSITHRITGAALFVGIAFGLYALDMALSSAAGFDQAVQLLAQPFSKFILLSLLFVLVFHMIAGIKHLLLDFHIGDTVEAAKIGSIAVIVLTVIVTAGLGARLW